MTNTDLTPRNLEILENIVDLHGIDSVLMALSEICELKADHVAHSWQDPALAKRWNILCGALGVLVPKANGL